MCAVVDSSVTFSGFEESMTKRPMYTDQHHSEIAFHRFSLLREKNILTDAVILSSDDKRFNVHSAIMAGASAYFFNKLLNGNDHDTTTACTAFDSCQLNIDSLILELIITFCYTGCIELTADNVECVLGGAKELQIESLMLLCGDMLEGMLNINNCIGFLEIADKHGLNELRDNALAIISNELPHINKLPEFYHLNGTQIFWLIELLSNSQYGYFGSLLNSVYLAESTFCAIRPELFGDDTQTAFRAAFIAGFFEGTKHCTSQTQLSRMQITEYSVLEFESSEMDLDMENESKEDSEPDLEPVPLPELEEPTPIIHILGIFKRKTIQLSTFCEIEQKWEKSTHKIELTHAIESFRDAIMISVDEKIVIFHMQNGSISQAQYLTLDSIALENITLPNDVECANLALFCQLNDKIYCFPRSDQQFFHRFDPMTKVWSTGQIDDVKDARYIVGMNDELYFVGCGFNRTMVRSYHFLQDEWTPRGNLRYENKQTCFRAIALNGSIYVVMSCYDSAKIYNGTEFLIQRYDENVEDWVIIKRIYYSHFVDHFNLDVAGNCLYLTFGDGIVEVYNEELNEWIKGPAIEYNVLDVSMCIFGAKPHDNWMHLHKSAME